MDEQQFWLLINRAKIRAGDAIDARISTLSDELKPLNDEDLAGFHNQLLNAHRELYRQAVWAAASIAMGGLADDSFEYFRNWLISEGHETFLIILNNPDDLVGFKLRGICGRLDQFGYVAADLLLKRGIESDFPCTGEELPGAAISHDECVGRFPRLAAKYGITSRHTGE